MPARISEYCKVVPIEGAGRGVIASRPLTNGAEVLACSNVAAHVIFREYRKEVCGQCWAYDRGTTLPIRCNELGKTFCSVECKLQWLTSAGPLGVQSYESLARFVNSHSKSITTPAQNVLDGARPSTEDINDVWSSLAALKSYEAKPRAAITTSLKHNVIDPDILGILLSAVLTYHYDPTSWSIITELAMDITPFKTLYDLQMHYQSFKQLLALLPVELKSSCTPEVCLKAIQAGSHNAFGIRSGSDDGEEYMGYAIYPQASYFNHSCVPNIGKKRIGRTWYFYCVEDVALDVQLCISYLGGDEKDLSLAERRARLERTWGFVCECQRCIREEEEEEEEEHRRQLGDGN